MSRQILNGWKEISNHIERGVRTAQRWEALLGMPVHRPALRDRSAVVAFSDELERWLSRPSLHAQDEGAAIDGKGESGESLLRVFDNMSTMVWHTSELASQIRALQEQLRRSLKIHHNRIASRTRARTASRPSRGMGSVLIFRSRKRILPLESMVSGGDLRGRVDQSGRAPGLQNLTVNETCVDFAERSQGEKARHKR